MNEVINIIIDWPYNLSFFLFVYLPLVFTIISLIVKKEFWKSNW